tara:strand:- start:2 stop:385 length:384 start_codon:yes stop_codon:yes gene_type:complete
MSTVKAANLQNTGSGAPTVKNSSGTEIGQFAKAWVNFNGSGTVAIRDSFNVSSITDNATGRYTINFTNAFSNANYAAAGLADFGIAQDTATTNDTPFTTTTAKIVVYHTANFSDQDRTQINVVFFGD